MNGERKPRAYGYVRVSTGRQADSGLSLEAQKEQIQRYFAYALANTHDWGGFYEDPAVSGGVLLRKRPAGGQLETALESGDSVIFSKLDRGFRSALDFMATLERWEAKKVAVHLLDLNLDTSTPIGRMIAGILSHVAEFERRRIGDRVREANARKRARKGGPALVCGIAPYGFHWAKRSGRKVLEKDVNQRKWGAHCLDWYQKGWTVEAIYHHLCKLHVKGRKGKEWSVWAVRRAIVLEWHYQCQEAQGQKATYSREFLDKPVDCVCRPWTATSTEVQP